MSKEIPSYLQDLGAISLLSFRSEGKALFYSGKWYEIDGTLLIDNWTDAQTHATKYDMIPVEYTEGGKYLSNPIRYNLPEEIYTNDDADDIWRHASRLYSNAASGDIRTLVCCSNAWSVFRSVELRCLLKNQNVQTINGKPREHFQAVKEAVFNRLASEGMRRVDAVKQARAATYRKAALQEIRQQFNEAANDNDLRKNAELKLTALRLFVRKELRDVRQFRKTRLEEIAEAATVQTREMLEANPHLVLIVMRHAHAAQNPVHSPFRQTPESP